MSEQDTKAITLFFFFTMLEEKRALRAASEVVLILQKKLKLAPSLALRPTMVSLTNKIWHKYEKKILRGQPQFSHESGWRLPSHVELSPWVEFQKKSSSEELLILTWSKILHFSDSEIAEGLQTTMGTVRFRVGRALRRLGEFCHDPQNPFTVVPSEH